MQKDELAIAPPGSLPTIRRRLVLAACFGLPIVLLLACYVWLALDHGTPWLWNVVVHEGGRHTLQHTIFYFSHFLREVPVDVAYALFLAAYFCRLGGAWDGDQAVPRRRVAAVAALAIAAAAVLVVVALAAVSTHDGLGRALDDLLQYRTRDDLSSYGSHWHFHWLSTIWFGATAMLIVPFQAAILGVPYGGRRPDRTRVTWIPWLYVLAVTLIFGLSSDIFLDVRYAGHQAREIITHGPITAFVGLGSLSVVWVWLRPDQSLSGKSVPPIHHLNRGTWIALALFFAIPLFLALVSWSGDVMEAGQSEHGLAAMVGGHVFEHVLDYVFVAILSTGIYGILVHGITTHGD